MNPRQPHNQWDHRQDYKVHGQDVEVVGHIGQGHEVDQTLRRRVHEGIEVEPADIVLASRGPLRAQIDDHQDDQEETDVRPPDLPDSKRDPCGAQPPATLCKDRAESDGGGKTRAEDKPLRCIG